MKHAAIVGVVVFGISCGVAAAQGAPDAVAPPALPPPGTLASTTYTKKVDAYGNTQVQTKSTYRNGQGVAQDSQTTTTTVPAPPPPPVTTTTTTSSTTTGVPN